MRRKQKWFRSLQIEESNTKYREKDNTLKGRRSCKMLRQDFHPNPFVLRKTFGSLLLHIGITEYVATANNIEQQDVDKDKVNNTQTVPLGKT